MNKKAQTRWGLGYIIFRLQPLSNKAQMSAFVAMPRPYVQHTTATIKHLRQHYHRQPMREIAAKLGIPTRKLYDLAGREGIRKRRE